MGLFDSWSSFAGGIVSGVEDLGGFVSQNLGTIVSGYFDATKDKLGSLAQNATPISNATTTPSYFGPGGYGPTGGYVGSQAGDGAGLPVNTLVLLGAGGLVIYLLARK